METYKNSKEYYLFVSTSWESNEALLKIPSIDIISLLDKGKKIQRKDGSLEHDIKNEDLSEMNETIKDEHLEYYLGLPDEFHCKECTVQFSTQKSLEEHLKVHMNQTTNENDDKPFKCGVCSKGFSQKSGLNRHLRIHGGVIKKLSIHIAEKLYECEMCKKTFASNSNLTSHKRVHSGEKPYSCETCNKSFSQSSSLTTHKRVHSSKKPYKCEICGKEYANSSNLKKHSITIHCEKCDVCGDVFNKGTDFRNHLSTHIIEKSYKCRRCGKGFSLKSNWEVHLWVEHSQIANYGQILSYHTQTI